MATNTYKCTECKRQVERVENARGLDILSKCVITAGCRGKLRKTGRNLDNIRESFPKFETNLQDYAQRNAFAQHQQDIASNSWVVTHGLNTNPAVFVFVKDDAGKWQPLPNSAFSAEPVSSNVTKLSFPAPTSGIVQFFARSSASTTVERKVEQASMSQVTVGGSFVFALPKFVTKGGSTIDLKNPISDIKLEVVIEKPNQEEVWCFEKLTGMLDLTPWSGIDEVLVAKRRNYYLKTKNILNFTTFSNPDMTFEDIPEGTRLRIVAVDYGTGVTVPVESKGLLMLLAAAPYEFSDKIRNKFLDLGELFATGRHLTYSNGEFFVETSAIEKTYPPIEAARRVGPVPPLPSPTPTPTVTPTITVTPTNTVTPTVTRTATPTPTVTPSVTSSVTPTPTPTITVTSSVTASVTPTPTITPSSTPASQVQGVSTVGMEALKGVGYANGLWVAVGINGKIHTSVNATDWTPRTSGTTNRLTGVAYGNGVWVAVGDNVSVYSSDGITWNTGTGLETKYAGKLRFINGQFIATLSNWNNEADLAISSDGITWSLNTIAAVPGATGKYIHDLTYDGLQYIYTGGDGDPDTQIYTAPNTTDLTIRLNDFGGQGMTVAHGNGIYVVHATDGIVYRSIDSVNWASIGGNILPINKDVNDSIFAAGKFYGVGTNGTIVSSADGLTWAHMNSEDLGSLNSVASDGISTLVVVGEQYTSGALIYKITPSGVDAITPTPTPTPSRSPVPPTPTPTPTISVTPSSVFSAAALNSKIASWWKFDGDLTDSVGTNHLTGSSTYAAGIGSYSNPSTTLDGSTFPALTTTNFAMGGRFRFNSTGSTFMCQRTSTGGSYERVYFIRQADGSVGIGLHNGSSYVESAYSSPGTTTTGTWYSIVGTYDGTTLKLYLNGTQVASTAATSVPGAATFFQFGFAYGGDYGTDFDECFVASSALTPEEVTYLHNSGAGRGLDQLRADAGLTPTPTVTPTMTPTITPSSSAPVTFASTVMADSPWAWWKLNEGTDTITQTTDYSGNNRHLTTTINPAANRGKAGIISDGNTSQEFTGVSGSVNGISSGIGTFSGDVPLSFFCIFKPTSMSTSHHLIHNGNTTVSSGQGQLLMLEPNGQIHFHTFAGGSWRDIRSNIGTVALNETAIIGWTHDPVADQIVFYKNGVAVNTVAYTTGLGNAALNGNWALGGLNGNSPGAYGLMQHAMVFNYVLSPQRALAHAQAAGLA